MTKRSDRADRVAIARGIGGRESVGRTALSTTLALALVACGGGGGRSEPPIGGGPTPTPTPPVATCSIENQLAFADEVLEDFYVFPDLLDDTVDPADFNDVQSFLDARTAPARAAGNDRGFTFATSIEEENALIESGETAGFGIRLAYDNANDRVFLFEAFENGPGFMAGLDRGSELLAIGTDAANLQSVSSLMATGGPRAVIEALGPSRAGVQRVIRFAQPDGTVIERTITKAEFSIDPISERYGTRIIRDGPRTVGYLNYRTFITQGGANQLRDAFELFNDRGVTDVIVDLRYNGGGLVSNATVLGSLLGEGLAGEVFSIRRYNPAQSARDETQLFNDEPNALRPDRIAFITTRASASASELVINSLVPYYGNDIALIGENTSGKPVGQDAFDLPECDLRIRALTFQTFNADGFGDYFDGLAPFVPNTCRARDDIFEPLGNRREDSIAVALNFIAGGTCTPIRSGSGLRAQSVGGRQILQPERPRPAQHENPGLF